MNLFVLWQRPRGPLRVAAACAVFLTLAVPSWAQTMRRYKLSEMVSKSDQIFVGQCVKKEALLRDGNIVSRYTLQPSEVLKADKNGSSGEVIVEELGGELRDGPVPVGQLVTGMADLQQGEEVLLFALHHKSDPKMVTAKASNPALKSQSSIKIDPSALRIIGLSQGHFTVLSDPQTGKKLVAPGDRARMALEKRAHADAPTSGPLVLKNSVLNLPVVRDAAKAKQLSQTAAAADEILPFEQLDQVKQRITQLVQKSK